MNKPIIWSYGGGNQSIAIALLIAQGKLPKPYKTVFVNTGQEASETFEYKEKYVAPLLAQLGISVEMINTKDWATVDLYGKNGDLLIPAYTQKGKLPTFCSKEWKTRPVHRYLRSQGIDQCIMWLGMSTDEVERLKPADAKWIEHHWPLCGMPTSANYGIQMNRADCRQLILNYGWPDPPKSSCYDCPHQDNATWQRRKTFYPLDFLKAVQRDKEIRARDQQGGVFLHESRLPLDQVDFTKPAEPTLFGCDSGFCWT